MIRCLILVLILSSVATFRPPAADAQETCPWQAQFDRMLGIAPQGSPRDGEPIRFVDATVVDPDRLFSLGLIGVEKGDHIKLLCVGDNQWRIKHYATGLVIFFSTDPPRSGANPS
jgi:hypothetical protein